MRLLASVAASAYVALLLIAGESHAGIIACNKSWAAAVSGDWNDASKWNPVGVPVSSDDVCVDASGTYTVTLEGTTGNPSLSPYVVEPGATVVASVIATRRLDDTSPDSDRWIRRLHLSIDNGAEFVVTDRSLHRS